MSGTVDEKAEPRRLVVCGMTVMSPRSWSPNAPLTTTAGRVFPAMPKSISQDLTAAGDVGPNGVRPRTSAAGPYKQSNRAAEAAPISSSSKGPESKGRERRSTSCVKARFSSTGRCSKASSSASVSLLMNTSYHSSRYVPSVPGFPRNPSDVTYLFWYT